MSLEKAIPALQAEVDALAKAPQGSSLWFLRQAKSFGLSLMKQALQGGVDDPLAFDDLRRRLRRDLMNVPTDAP